MLFPTYFVGGDPSIVKSRGKYSSSGDESYPPENERMSPKSSEFQKERQQGQKKTYKWVSLFHHTYI